MKKQNENTTQTALPKGGEEPITPEGVTLNELQAENEQLKTTIRLSAAHRQITGELATAGARSPQLMFDSIKADLQFGDDGKPTNAAALIGRLRTAFPEQFGVDAPAYSIDAGAHGKPQPALTKGMLSKMKPSEIAALDWDEVRRALAGA